MTPDQYCQDKAARSGSSFYYSFLFLPPERRRAITALYAFCREVDDVVDEIRDKTVAATKLAWWRLEVERLYAGEPTHPVTKALQPNLEPFGITRKQLVEVIDGMQMDLEQTRYLDFAGLRLYCRRVAGVIGELSAAIFGFQDKRTLQYADELGLAFQLTNIIRDVGEDARVGRVYIPLEDLQRHSLAAHQLLAARATDQESEAFRAMMREQVARAREHYRTAFELLPDVDRRAQRPGLIMSAIYSALLDEIERDQYRVMTQRIALTPLRKFWLAWRTWVTANPPRITNG
ncbi:MAG TPA: presqualene diphosphate synthase HpnD [Lautropia sp.]|nr:presqualene diphosphate synthase HpnD [Lautropia sp.]